MIGLVGFDLHHRYRRRTVLNGLTVFAQTGTNRRFIGAKRSGKTTTFRILAGQLMPKGGRVEMEGIDITKWPLWRRARHGLAYVPQQSTVLASADGIGKILIWGYSTPKQMSGRLDDMRSWVSLVQRDCTTEGQNPQWW